MIGRLGNLMPYKGLNFSGKCHLGSDIFRQTEKIRKIYRNIRKHASENFRWHLKSIYASKMYWAFDRKCKRPFS